MKRRVVPHILAAAAFAAAVWILPVLWCGREASAWMEGDPAAQLRLARGVERLVLSNEVSRANFRTGSSQFDGEWLFGSYLMAGIGFGQMALEHPELAPRHAGLMAQCIDRLLSAEVRAFDAETWGEDPMESLDGTNAHAAYLGYLNLLLGLHRAIAVDSEYADLNDRITESLLRRIAARQISLIESYPGEVYPVDNCFVIGSVGLHQRVSGRNHGDAIRRWSTSVRDLCIDPGTGLLIQAVDAEDGMPCDAPRGSGTALGLLALQYADPDLAHELYAAIKRNLAGTWLRFGAVREYPKGVEGRGDIDSGPIVFGYGLSTTGFAIAGARMYGDGDYFRRLLATAHLCGAPVELGESRHYISGGALGNAILFAMLTAPRADLAAQHSRNQGRSEDHGLH